ncbi:MAG: FAD-dependent monooxygenase, partial [Parvularculaceae bacterium]|nr:FAD-dependent monooxygenase [Parvularculaceae bacterium]
GHEVSVYEQAPELAEIGAGIQLSATGSRVLRHIGIGDKIESFGVRPGAYVFRLFHNGETLQEFPLAEQHEEKHGSPYLQVHRADVHNALIARFEELAPGATHLNHTLTSYEEHDDGVVARFANGAEVEGDILIGADGIKSVVRKQLLGDTPAHFTGQSAWRVLVPTDRLPANFMDEVMSVWVGPGRHAVIYYVRGGELINFVGCVDSPEWTDDSWLAKADWSEMMADFEGWNDEVMQILNAADKDSCFRWALYNRPPSNNWSSDRVTLLGDSCHATLPYLAQGAVMAIEDGAVLSRALAQVEDVPGALQLYQRNRIDRTARIVNESSDNARLFHLPSEEALREAFAARQMGKERDSWLYNYDALSVPLS